MTTGTSRSWRANFSVRTLLASASLALVPVFLWAFAAGPSPSSAGSSGAPADVAAGSPPATAWGQVDYGPLVDRRQLSHSGEPVGVLLARLQGRPYPRAGERPEDVRDSMLLDPLLEPYAFVLPDALDSLAPPPEPPMVEVGGLWRPGEAQPAWVELLRARRYVVESDGQGRFRLFLPLGADSAAGAPGDGSSAPALDSSAAAQRAWEGAWPVLRHVFAAERRRLAQRAGDRPEDHPIEAVAHAYVHFPARSLFYVGLRPYRTTVAQTGPAGERVPPDLGAWQRFLDRGLQLEGGRLDGQGSLRLLGSEAGKAPGILGRPLTLADYAVAYRSVFHGGLAEPYMSLDPWYSPQTAQVTYGGRLRDTGLGLVSLLSDARFKTFSLGMDVSSGTDVRGRIRENVPRFRTHMERFAADAQTRGVLGQQTRFWFYPDSVELTLSDQGDVLVIRRARMSAASERLGQETRGGAQPPGAQTDPPWTRETIAEINGDYDPLAQLFPEMADLDQLVRLLSLFAWLKQASAEGLAVPDLDALLALELPAEPTPRLFPMLLTLNTLPPPGKAGVVDVLDRAPVGEALDRLAPLARRPLPAAVRLRRALDSLDRRLTDHAALARQIESLDAGSLDDNALDELTLRAERLRMHYLVLNTVPRPERGAIMERQKAEEGARVLSVSIGGVDLGMSSAVARASRGDRRVGWGGSGRSGAAGLAMRTSPGAVALAPEGGAARPSATAAPAAPSTALPRPGALADPPELPPTPLPDHGLLAGAPAKGLVPPAFRRFGNNWIRKGSSPVPSIEAVMDADGPETRARRLILDGEGRARLFERVEDLRLIRYAVKRQGGEAGRPLLLACIPSNEPVPAAPSRVLDNGEPAAAAASAAQPLAPPPQGLVTIDLLGADASAVSLRLRFTSAGEVKELSAAVPRQLLLRMILGRQADLTPGQPLGALHPLPAAAGEAPRVMVLMKPAQTEAPWAGGGGPLPSEEDPVRIAAALGRWSAEHPGAGQARPLPVVVGVDPAVSPGRWQSAPQVGGGALLLLPDGSFPGRAAPMRDELARSWQNGGAAPGSLITSLPAGAALPELVLLASAEPPGPFAARLRALARNPAMKGKLLAAWSLAGPFRQDLPASLLAEGILAGVSIVEVPPVGLRAVSKEIAAMAAGGGAAKRGPGARVEELPGPRPWYF